MRLKPGVSVRGVRSELFVAAYIAEGVWRKNGAPELVITCGTDGKHSVGSFHYVGLALDFRTSNLPGGYVGKGAQQAVADLKEALGPEYDIVLERDHVHVEFQPKLGLNLQ